MIRLKIFAIALSISFAPAAVPEAHANCRGAGGETRSISGNYRERLAKAWTPRRNTLSQRRAARNARPCRITRARRDSDVVAPIRFFTPRVLTEGQPPGTRQSLTLGSGPITQ